MTSRGKQGTAFVPDGDRRGSDVPPAPDVIASFMSCLVHRTMPGGTARALAAELIAELEVQGYRIMRVRG